MNKDDLFTTQTTIPVRVRIIVYENHRKPGSYVYTVDNYGEIGPTDHAVWLEAEVPVRPITIEAQVSSTAPVSIQTTHPACRERQKALGMAYPRSSCEKCGTLLRPGWWCAEQVEQEPSTQIAAERNPAGRVFMELVLRLHNASRAQDRSRVDHLNWVIAVLETEFPDDIAAEKARHA